jgi:beta-mannosidase
MRRYIYRDGLIAAANDGRVLVRSDDPFQALQGGLASVSLLHVDTGVVSALSSFPVSLPIGAGASMWACANTSSSPLVGCTPWSAVLPSAGCASDGSDCIVLLRLTNATGGLVADNFELLTAMGNMTLPQATVSFAIGAVAPDGSIPITLTSTATALFVTLTTLAQGRFSDNAILLSPGPGGATVVSFLPWGGLQEEALLASSLRVEHVMLYGTS